MRQRIGLLLVDDMEAGAPELAEQLDVPPGLVAYHLRVLYRSRAIAIVPDRRSAPPRYRWSSRAQWARRLLGESGEGDG